MKKRLIHSAVPALAMLLGLSTAASATTVTSGDLFFTTFQTQGLGLGTSPTNLFKVSFIYDSVTGLCLTTKAPGACPAGPPVVTAVANLTGADGLIFDPNDASKLLVTEQYSGLVASIGVNGLNKVEVAIDGTGGNKQAFGIVSTPNKSQILVFPNDPGTNPLAVVGLPLTAAGTNHFITVGTDRSLRDVAFDQAGTAYYGNDNDDVTTGGFGKIDLSTFITTPVLITDLTGGNAGQTSLPSHSVIYDSYSGCMIITGSTEIWQLCSDGSGGFNIVAKVSAPGNCVGGFAASASCGTNNWDQASVDGLGHMFVASNDGDLLFIDYHDYGTNPSRKISIQKYAARVTLASNLDDIANGGGAPPQQIPPGVDGRMTGGGSVFTTGGVRVTHGFELHCDIADVPNRLEVNWDKGNNFHLTSLTSANCVKDPLLNAGHPTNTFTTYTGTGKGLFNGIPGATATWTFTDAGEPGTNDTAAYVITDAQNQAVLTVNQTALTKGNQQAHLDNK